MTNPIDKEVANDTCCVRAAGELLMSEDFIAFLYTSNGEHTLLYHTDPITMGIAVQQLNKQFLVSLSEYSEEDQFSILDTLKMLKEENNEQN